ncbi:MAG: GNAT family N-acetyltransferase [Anaerolineae bacterium]|nr:GNAT family N-acetyltransferase [Anaerolineae bacterium]
MMHQQPFSPYQRPLREQQIHNPQHVPRPVHPPGISTPRETHSAASSASPALPSEVQPHHQVILPIRVVNIQPEHFAGLAQVQRLAFPTLTDDERYSPEKYAKHIELFPEGQFVALAEIREGEWVCAGSTSTFRTNFEFGQGHFTFMDSVADGWLTHHNPEGAWIYGADISVHPNFRGMRVGRRLYEARHKLVQRLNLRGEIAGGMIPGYDRYREHLTVAQYVLHVHQARLHDPTLTMQLRNGFAVRGILYDHITDPRSDNACTLIIRDNPHYQPKTPEG